MIRVPNRISDPINVLIVDDDPAVLSAYCEVLKHAEGSTNDTAIRQLRSKLFQGAAAPAAKAAASGPLDFVLTVCSDAEQAVAAVSRALADEQPFALIFLDMRMPPGPDGAWAAEQIRKIDPEIQIVMCTAYTDVDPADIGRRVQPEDKLFYLAKPFHPHEIRQLASALGHRWHAERLLVELAYFDSLTGLPNRQLFRSRLSAAVTEAALQSHAVGILYLDLDNFKRINDTLGHDVGDHLLKVTADRLRKCLRADDSSQGTPRQRDPGNIARIGGDEFVILLPSLPDPNDANSVAERVVRALQIPVQLTNHEVVVTPSIGIAIYPTDGEDIETLFRHADLAMYFSKRQRPGGTARYTSDMSAGGLQRLTIETQLRGALERNEFTLNYQPQFDLSTGLISGMEALLRWNNIELRHVSPAEFIPIAEETGMIIPIGEWVLRTACIAAKSWNVEGSPPVRVAVNVSGLQFAQHDLPQLVTSVLEQVGLDPALLEIELTESVVMKDESRTIGAIAALKATGVLVAIDDFGTGYSSLSRLRDFAVDRLKIDRSFVQNMVTRPSDYAVAHAIIAMAHSLGLSVVAEGVEEFPQLMSLQDQKCGYAQGFLLSVPLSGAAAKDLLVRLASNVEGSRTQRLRQLVEFKEG